MAFMLVVGDCYGCKRTFTFSAERVPSIVVDGVRQPVCRDCVTRANLVRRKKGLPEITILPGAYEADEVS